jgi:penicillin-binding protein 2
LSKRVLKEYGYSPQSVIGYSGVEEYYDDDLKGGGGGLQIEVDSRGRQVRLLSLKEPIKGQDIVLTIDSSIQQSALELLDDKIGTIIVMDMDNGEILGLTSSPAFDPNILVQSEGDANKRRIAALFSNPSSPFLNRAIKGLFPPGSVFKVAVAIGALDSKKITQHTPFVCTGVFELGGRKFRCTHAHGTQNLIESIVHSCNVYFYHLGLILGADTISHYAKQLGLGSLTHIDLPYEGVGNVPSRRQRLLSGGGRWYAGDTLNLSIGQGDVLVTPIQLVRMMATIARNGVEVQPHLIKAIGGLEVAKYLTERQIKIDKKHFQTVQKALRATVSNYSGTAHVLDIQDLHIAGKTGTAQTSGGRENHAWFVGYVKGKKRNFSFCVFLEHGGSSQNACILARQLLLKMQNEKIL